MWLINACVKECVCPFISCVYVRVCVCVLTVTCLLVNVYHISYRALVCVDMALHLTALILVIYFLYSPAPKLTL